MEEQMIIFNDFSDEVLFNCFQHLDGREASLLASVSRAWSHLLGPGSGALWKTLGAQEFGNTNLQAPPAPKDKTASVIDYSGVDRYASLARAASLKRALWGQVGTRGFGSREGTPWLFIGRTGEDLFAFGGFGPYGPANDLMVASLSSLKKLLSITSAGIVPGLVDAVDDTETASAEADAPRLDFSAVRVRGSPPTRSYGATLTPLVDDELPGCVWFDLEHVKSCLQPHEPLPEGLIASKTTLILVTGGYLSGGYRNESPDWKLGLVYRPSRAFDPPDRIANNGSGNEACDEAPPEIIWLAPGPSASKDGSQNGPTPRSNASAVFVPSRFADSSRYPNGYVMLFGGNAGGLAACNTIDILDLSTFTWEKLGHLPNAPPARNSHSAVLMPDSEEPESKAKILIFGGGDGRDIPRAGHDLSDCACFDPRMMDWIGTATPPPVEETEGDRTHRRSAIPGRAHTVMKVGRSVLFFGGGRNPTNSLTAVNCQQLSDRCALRRRSSSGTLDDSGEENHWQHLLGTLEWKKLTPCGGALPPPRAFHGAVSLAPAGVPVLLIYGGWSPTRGNYGDIWAAKLDSWARESWTPDPDAIVPVSIGHGVAERAMAGDRRFSQTLGATTGSHEEEDDDDDDFHGPFVNVGGRIMPLEMFAQMLAMQMGREQGNQMMQMLLRQQGMGGDDDDDDDENEGDEQEEEDEDEVDANDESAS